MSSPPALRRLCGCGVLLFLAGRLRAWLGGPPVSYRRVLCVLPFVLPGWGVAHLGGVGPRVFSLATVPPVFLLFHSPASVHSWVGGASSLPCLYFCGRFACSFLCPPWAGARTRRHTVWLTGSLSALWLAAGRAPAPCVVWFVYPDGLVACLVRLGSGTAGSAVALASFVG